MQFLKHTMLSVSRRMHAHWISGFFQKAEKNPAPSHLDSFKIFTCLALFRNMESYSSFYNLKTDENIPPKSGNTSTERLSFPIHIAQDYHKPLTNYKRNLALLPLPLLAENSKLTPINERFLQFFDAYVAEIEKASKFSISLPQRMLLMDYAKNNPFVLLLKSERNQSRQEYNHIKSKLVAQWEENTGHTWPWTSRHNEYYKGKLISNKPTPYQLHHVILLGHGGPNVWWNMHPVPPLIHQEWIHGNKSESKKIFT